MEDESELLADVIEVIAVAAVGGVVGTTVAGWLDRERERRERGAAGQAERGRGGCFTP